VATAVVSAIGNRAAFHKGREFAAWLGLVPRQWSLEFRTHLFTRPNFRFSVLRCAIQAASGRTAVAGCPPVLRATDMPTHSVLSHIKGQNARDSRFESWDAPPNSPPPELFTTNDTFSIAGFEWHG
jgi:hypothetical protein